jgi:pimeloyl-ACP methyl ester carboxylesterase
MISAAFPYQKQRRRVLGREMAYVEMGGGDPIVLLHGNPTSSYLWRNVLPHLQPLSRCIAPDLIGLGDSDKLPDSGPGSYRFVEHRRYLDALLEGLDVRERVTFVVHDWGSALGFDWANRHRESVKGIAYMEAIGRPQAWDHRDKMGMREFLQALRSKTGEAMVLQDNFFVEGILPGPSCAPSPPRRWRSRRQPARDRDLPGPRQRRPSPLAGLGERPSVHPKGRHPHHERDETLLGITVRISSCDSTVWREQPRLCVYAKTTRNGEMIRISSPTSLKSPAALPTVQGCQPPGA